MAVCLFSFFFSQLQEPSFFGGVFGQRPAEFPLVPLIFQPPPQQLPSSKKEMATAFAATPRVHRTPSPRPSVAGCSVRGRNQAEQRRIANEAFKVLEAIPWILSASPAVGGGSKGQREKQETPYHSFFETNLISHGKYLEPFRVKG